MAKIRERLSYAKVMATAAVFIALGGTSYALSIPRNSIGSGQIRRNAVGASELRSKAVRSKDIRDGSIRLADVSAATRVALRGQQGRPGPPGPPGVFSASVNSGGEVTGGNGHAEHRVIGLYDVRFDR